MDMVDMITKGAPSARTRVVLDMPPYSQGLEHGALRDGKWKLVIESSTVYGSYAWSDTPRTPPPGFIPPEPDVPPAPYDGLWLFNMETDPYEKVNLAQTNPDQLSYMVSLFKQLQLDAVADLYNSNPADPAANPAYNTDKAWSPWTNVTNSKCFFY
eukprot:TRINITY_DN1898_c0_g1_i1.p1 TRINITY_DN1898_c0_g1~~TRINITY_DN1898_c0_g1_i1.p1  ORF type:complete len:176 (-),score=50.45 TRINITY_DN1898_c0_g1_i1:38-505(-)